MSTPTGIVNHAFANSWIGSGCMATAWGLKREPVATAWNYQKWYQFGSEHPQKVLFTFGDGAVRVWTKTSRRVSLTTSVA